MVDLQCDAICRPFDLCLLKTLLDGGHSAALVLNLLHELHHRGFNIIGHGLHDVGPGEGVNCLGHVRLIGDDLLSAQRQARRLLARQGKCLVEGVGVQRLGASQNRAQALQSDAHHVDLGLLCG